MKNKSLTFIGLALTVLGIVACSPQNTPKTSTEEISQSTSPATPERTIVLTDISDNPQKKIRRFQPLANYIAANSDQFDRGKVKIAPDMDTLVDWLKSGEADIYIDSPYPAMLAVNNANAKPILRRWKEGNAEYYSLIFTLNDHNIKSLSDLKGKTIALEDSLSTTGYMLPLGKLIESGLDYQKKASLNSTISDNVIGYIFSYEDENSIESLLSGKVAAAAIDNYSFSELSDEIREKAVILAETDRVARNLVIVRGDMPSEQIEAISSILLEMHKTDEGKVVLEKFNDTTKFDQFPSTENLNRIQEIYRQTKDK